MKRSTIVAAAALLAALASAMPARSELVITIQNPGLVSPNGTTTLDVFIRSNTPGGDLLNFFQYQFEIALVSGTGRFDFQAYDYSTLADEPNYVFAGLGTSPYASVTTTNVPNDTFSGGDTRPDLDNTSIDGTDRLLTRLVIGQTATNLIPTDGSTFSIALVPAARLASDQAPNNPTGTTFFYYHQDDDDLPNSFGGGPIVFTVGATAVPEPGSLSALACGLASLGAWRARRSRQDRGA